MRNTISQMHMDSRWSEEDRMALHQPPRLRQEILPPITYNGRSILQDIDDLILSFDIDEEHFTLMNAQHLIAYLAGFENWSDLLHASDAALELGELLFNDRTQYGEILRDYWDMYLTNLPSITDKSKLELFKLVFFSDMT